MTRDHIGDNMHDIAYDASVVSEGISLATHDSYTDALATLPADLGKRIGALYPTPMSLLGSGVVEVTREFARAPGIGPAKADLLARTFIAGIRVGLSARESPIRERISDPQAAGPFFISRIGALPVEVIEAAYLDSRKCVITVRTLTRGSTHSTVVDPGQVFRPAVSLGARAVILAHNHPTGDPQPSGEDYDVTARCIKAGRILGISLADHLVVAANNFVSIRELGVLDFY